MKNTIAKTWINESTSDSQGKIRINRSSSVGVHVGQDPTSCSSLFAFIKQAQEKNLLRVTSKHCLNTYTEERTIF